MSKHFTKTAANWIFIQLNIISNPIINDANGEEGEGDNADVDEERRLPLLLHLEQAPLGLDNSQPPLIMQHHPNPQL